MSNATTISRYNELVQIQVACEAFLKDLEGKEPNDPAYINALTDGNKHRTKFIKSEAEAFTQRYEIMAHKENTTTGFSGTLFRDRKTDEYIMSFRSTEFVDDQVCDSQGTNQLSIKNCGFAFGQICDMEDWYATLTAEGGPLHNQSTADLTVTGYSLAGHLATAFSILRKEAGEPEPQVVTFNGAGSGQILDDNRTLTSVIQDFRRIWKDHYDPLPHDITRDVIWNKALSSVNDVQQEIDRVAGLRDSNGNAPKATPEDTAFLDPWMHYALSCIKAQTAGAGPNSNANFMTPKISDRFGLENLTELYGSGVTFTASSGIHHSQDRIEVYIENQPLERGSRDIFSDDPRSILPYYTMYTLVDEWDKNAGGETHSIVHLQDSLALMETLSVLNEDFSIADWNYLFSRQTGRIAWKVSGDNGVAEGDTLESVVDAVTRALTGTDPKTRFPSGGVDLNIGGVFGEVNIRENFYEGLNALRDLIDNCGSSVELKKLDALSYDDVYQKISSGSADGMALAYALVAANPFVISGLDYSSIHNQNGELSIWDPDSSTGALTEQYLKHRLEFMGAALECYDYNGRENWWFDPVKLHYSKSTYDFTDIETGSKIYSSVLSVPTGDNQTYVVPSIVFGSSSGDIIYGTETSDCIYGGAGDDTLASGRGLNYLEGGIGHDKYILEVDGAADTILDVDKLGEIRIKSASGEETVSGVFKRDTTGIDALDPLRGQMYYSADRRFGIRKEGENCALYYCKDNGSAVRVADLKGWSDTTTPYLGLTLAEEKVQIENPPGATNPGEVISNAAGVIVNPAHYYYFNAQPSPEGVTILAAANVSNQIHGSHYGDIIVTGNGRNTVNAYYGNDYIIGGTGSDYISAGANAAGIERDDDDYVAGGGSSDLINGGNGNDVLWAGDGGDWSFVDDGGYVTQRGDWLNGQRGDDELMGSADNDVLAGGSGNDKTVYPFAMAA